MNKDKMQKFWELVDKYDRFLLCLHVNADADSLCSNIAMAELLTARHKTVTILAGKNTSFSRELHGLGHWLQIVSNHTVEQDYGAYDCFIMLDAHNEYRLYDAKDISIPKIIIDHHAGNVMTGAELAIVEPAYSSASQMVFELAVAHGPFTDDFLLAVYMGMYSDTAGFRYGVSPGVYDIASFICKRVDPSKLVLAYNQSIGIEDLAVLKIVLENLKEFEVAGLKFFATTISQQDLHQKFGIVQVDWNSNIAIRLLAEIQGVQVLCVASEQVPGEWRVRFRSFVDGEHAKLLAEAFGGGGHAHAASGTFLNNEPRAVLAEVRNQAQKLFG